MAKKMTLQETITIVNNSGKIIKSGKQLYEIFKEAKGTYQEKKAQIQSERGLPQQNEPSPGLQRAHTFHPDQSSAPALPPRQHLQYYEDDDRYYYEQQRRRRSHDERSDTGSRRSRRSQSTHSRRVREPERSRPALTEGNLKTHSEVSSVRPSKMPPNAYRSPYAETMPMEMALSRRDMTMARPASNYGASNYGGGAMLPRNMSNPELSLMQKPKPKMKEIDMNLAYGSVPPDLEFRTDLAPNPDREAMSLVRRVQGLLDEANCVQHSARDTMTQLQKDPDRAAAVALSLADLSNVVKKSSPLVMTMLKSSPAVFSLLSSPHFLIGTSVVLGVTVVAFGGWKIVKRVREDREERAAAREALMYEQEMDRGMPMNGMPPMYGQDHYSHGVDEALILDDDLSSIETWRRGIQPFGEDESADFELITPEADRATRAMKDDFDVRSRRSTRTSKTQETHRSHRSSHSHSSRRDDDGHRSRRAPESIADSERSHRSHRNERSERSHRSSRSHKEEELPVRPKPQRTSSNMLKALFKNKDKEREMVVA